MLEKVILKNIVNQRNIKKHFPSASTANVSNSSVNTSDSINTSGSVNAKDSVSVSDENNNELVLTPEEKVMNAEIIQALKVVNSNYSFTSTQDDGERFRLMFPDSTIAKNFQQSKTKVNYTISMVYTT